MKNPLRKRLFKEFKAEIGKYLVIFIFMTATIGLISGFTVASSSRRSSRLQLLYLKHEDSL